MRFKIIRLIVGFLFLLIACELVYTQVFRGEYYYGLSTNNRIRVIPLEGRRGRILDRNEVVLADNRLSFDVVVMPQDLKDREELFTYLSKVLKVEKNRLMQQYQQRKQTPFSPVVVEQDVDRRTAMIIEENRFRFPGLLIQESFQRQYPLGAQGGHILGYVGKIDPSRIDEGDSYGYSYESKVGFSGVEEYYDQYLQGREGGLQIEINSRGRQVRLLGLREAQRGNDIQLTVDGRIQQIMASALGERAGAAILMELNSGEILGLVSSPAYDPNAFVDSRLRNTRAALFTDRAAPLLNRAIKGQYPPGSVFKIVDAIAALTTGKIVPQTTFMCPGYVRLGKQRFRCAHVHSGQDLWQAIAHSCNVYFYNVGELLGPDMMSKYAHWLGLGEATQIDLPSEEEGLVPSRLQRKIQTNRGWYRGDTLNFSIGQGDVLATPIQLLRLISTVALDGREVQPHVIKRIGEQEIISLGTVRQIRISPRVLEVVKAGLRMTISDPGGTARLLNMEGYEISGKTGTAQSRPGRDSHAWFVGYDLETPTPIAFCVFLEYGGSSYNAVVVAQQILQQIRDSGLLGEETVRD